MVDDEKDLELNRESDEDLEVEGEGVSGGSAIDTSIAQQGSVNQSMSGSKLPPKLPSQPPAPPTSPPARKLP
jgi:hypothetical protein